MHRQTNDTDLVRDGPLDGLSDPPRSVGAESETAFILEFFNCPDQPDISLFDNVGKGQAPVDITLADVHHEPQVCLDHVSARFRVAFLNAFCQGLFLGKGEQRGFPDLL